MLEAQVWRKKDPFNGQYGDSWLKMLILDDKDWTFVPIKHDYNYNNDRVVMHGLVFLSKYF